MLMDRIQLYTSFSRFLLSLPSSHLISPSILSSPIHPCVIPPSFIPTFPWIPFPPPFYLPLIHPLPSSSIHLYIHSSFPLPFHSSLPPSFSVLPLYLSLPFLLPSTPLSIFPPHPPVHPFIHFPPLLAHVFLPRLSCPWGTGSQGKLHHTAVTWGSGFCVPAISPLMRARSQQALAPRGPVLMVGR